MVQAVEDEKYFQRCPLYLATKIWEYFDRILELEDNEKKVYLEAKLPSTELSLEEKFFDHAARGPSSYVFNTKKVLRSPDPPNSVHNTTIQLTPY